MKAAMWVFGVAGTTLLYAQGPVSLPEVTVYSPRIANQAPAGTFAMPVSALRFEPRVDIQGRNLAESQADVTIRGGIFENTGFQVGAATLTDPQTGHYFAEIPVAPALLSTPEILTASQLAIGVTNATVGAVAHDWRTIRTAGFLAVGAGEYRLRRAEVYQGYATNLAGAQVGADISLARSESDGSVPFGEHEFDRLNFRLQRSTALAQTDLFAGYQGKRFGWPNLYTPFNSNETENLQTTLFALNHRMRFAGREYLEATLYHRRNKDDYAFNRFAPVGAVHPFQHTTWVTAGALAGRRAIGDVGIEFRGELLADELTSTSLTFGRYRTRKTGKLAVAGDRTWAAAGGSRTLLKLGATYDDTNRDGGAFSPLVEIAREFPSAAVRRVHFAYTKTTQLATYTALNSSAGAGLFRGNPDLGRSRSHSVEAGARGSVAGWTTEGAVFARRDDALVDWTFRRGVTARAANAVDVDVIGLELLARKAWSRGELVLGYTALSKDAGYRGAAVDASFYALNYARHRLTAALTLRLGRGFELRVDNAARLQAGNLLRTVGGDQAIATAVGLAWRPARRGFEASVLVDNLWDDDFQEVPAVPAARRQFSAGVSYTW